MLTTRRDLHARQSITILIGLIARIFIEALKRCMPTKRKAEESVESATSSKKANGPRLAALRLDCLYKIGNACAGPVMLIVHVRDQSKKHIRFFAVGAHIVAILCPLPVWGDPDSTCSGSSPLLFTKKLTGGMSWDGLATGCLESCAERAGCLHTCAE